MLLLFTGCTSLTEENTEKNKAKQTVSDCLTDYLNLKSSAFGYLSDYYFYSDEEISKIQIPEIEKALVRHLEFKIVGVQETENGFRVKTEFKNYDFADVFERIVVPNMEKQATDEKIIGLINAEIAKGNLEKKTIICEIPVSLFDTWNDAQAFCKANGGYLATISSQEENTFLFEYMKNQGYSNAYFGYTDQEVEGVWKWINGEKSTYTNWNSGEPNGENPNEDYAMFYYT